MHLPWQILPLALSFTTPIKALSSWYTNPGSTPAGSTAGDKIRGVNLGGWFILENWMDPDFFAVSPLDQYDVPDEWTYCSILGKEECQSRLEAHWEEYVTEDDFRRFANYSMNTVRIPVGYWMWTDILDYEPFVTGQMEYLDRALNWSSWYGLDVLMDLHSLPGGQNGQDNQGFKGPIEFQNNATNLDRALDALDKMTRHVTQDKFDGVVKSIELTNEPYIEEFNPLGMEFGTLADFYVKGYATIRAGEHIIDGGKELMVVVHDAFQPLSNWDYFFSQANMGLNWTNYGLDTHFYDAFGDSTYKSQQEHLDTLCPLGQTIAAAQTKIPIIVGEFSLGVNTYCVDYKSCFGSSLADTIANLTSYDASIFLRQYWEVQLNAFEQGAGWIFWSHKNAFGAPWSWSQSAAQNWIPEDPSERIWPYYPQATSYCLDINNPIQGDQNLPYFPPYVGNVSQLAKGFSMARYAINTSSEATVSNGTLTSQTQTGVGAGTSGTSLATAAASSTSVSGAGALGVSVMSVFAALGLALCAL